MLNIRKMFAVNSYTRKLFAAMIIVLVIMLSQLSVSAATLGTFVETSTIEAGAYSLAYGNGMFVAVGYKNTQYSADGYTWTAVTGLASSYGYSDIVFADGRFVAVGDGAYIAVSTDGINWTTQQLPAEPIYNNHRQSLVEVIYADGKYYTVGSYSVYRSSTGTRCVNTVYSSPDGVNWSVALSYLEPDSSSYAYTLAYANGQILVTGGYSGFAHISSDGSSWTRIETNVNTINDAIGANGEIFASNSSNTYFWDFDAQQWNITADTHGITSIGDIGYANAMWFTLGYSGAPAIEVSDDAAVWDLYSLNSTVSLSYPVDIVYGNGVYVVAAMYNIYTTRELFDITYYSNGGTDGNAPVDSNDYYYGETAIISGNTGSLVRNGYIFTGWNTKADGSGITYSAGSSVTMYADLDLYAQWVYVTIPQTGDGNTPWVTLVIVAAISLVALGVLLRRKRQH